MRDTSPGEAGDGSRRTATFSGTSCGSGTTSRLTSHGAAGLTSHDAAAAEYHSSKETELGGSMIGSCCSASSGVTVAAVGTHTPAVRLRTMRARALKTCAWYCGRARLFASGE